MLLLLTLFLQQEEQVSDGVVKTFSQLEPILRFGVTVAGVDLA
jgi:hypothetical protein